jgi:hypothetical protein
MSDDSKKPIPPEVEGWREIAERAAKEQNPSKLVELVTLLCEKLEEREAQLGNLHRPKL